MAPSMARSSVAVSSCCTAPATVSAKDVFAPLICSHWPAFEDSGIPHAGSRTSQQSAKQQTQG